MTDYFELVEIDESDVQMRLFSQTLTGDVKNGLKVYLLIILQIYMLFMDCLLIDG